jgi:hypothetical protein
MRSVCLLVFLTTLSATGQQGATQSTSLTEKAKLYISLSMFDNARQTLSAALAENEFDPLAHFLMGQLWLADKDWSNAAKEFRIAYSLQPMGFSAAGRMSLALAHQFAKSGERELRVDALQHAQAYVQRPRQEGADPFENAESLTTLDADVTAAREVLLGVSGRWVTGAGGEYYFQQAGNSGVYNVVPRGVVRFGYLRRTGPQTFEGTIASSGCAWELALRESDDGEALSGTIRISQPAKRACRQMAITKEALKGAPGPFNIHR